MQTNTPGEITVADGAGHTFFRSGQLKGFLEDLGFQRLLAQQPLQLAHLLLQSAVLGGGDHLLAGRRGGQCALCGQASPGEQLVWPDAVTPGNQAHRGARLVGLLNHAHLFRPRSSAADAAPT